MAATKAKESKQFPLRILNEKTYPALEKAARERYTSVNSLINSILEEGIKKIKKSPVKSL